MVNSERALWGWRFKSGEFFPGVLQTNPAPDMVTGISRLLLGYRLGPVINLLAVLWAAVSIESFLRDYITQKITRHLSVLFAVSTENTFYLLNLYMIDLLALQLIIESMYLVHNFEKIDRQRYAIIQIAFFWGCRSLSNSLIPSL